MSKPLQKNHAEQESEYEDESKKSILASFHTALQEVKEGKVHPIEELWDDIDEGIPEANLLILKQK